MKYKRGDSCRIKKGDKFVEGTVVKLCRPYHGSHYYVEGDLRYFVTEKKKVKSSAIEMMNIDPILRSKNDITKTYSESDLTSWEREWKISQLI